ncbi:MAG: HAMP domain-containing protein [Actinobacteria bacterium]|nr:HAMP domain-containing protein [Actinomycetota bacterium]
MAPTSPTDSGAAVTPADTPPPTDPPRPPDSGAQPHPGGIRSRLGRRPLSRVSIQSKLIVMLLISSILSAAVVGFIGYQSGRNSLRESVFDRLTQVRVAQAQTVRSRFTDLMNSLLVYTSGASTIDALGAFTASFDELADATISPDQQKLLDAHYGAFAERTEERSGKHIDAKALLPDTPAERYLQAVYGAPFESPDQAIRLDDARDGSAWSGANMRYNPFFRRIVTLFGFVDALLIDDRGNVVYSANKGVDLGTNVLTGPYREGNLRDAYQQTMASNSLDFVAVTDFAPYQPAMNAPTAWMVAPVGVNGRAAGALALQFPITGLNRLMTVNRQWSETGMGRTGESILIGSDALMRSDSRLFLEDPEGYKQAAVAAGTPPDVVDEAIRLGTTVLVQPVDGEAARRAQRGETGTLITRDYLGHDSLQAYAPVDLPGTDLHWSIVAKIDTAEAFAPERAFTRTIVLASAGIVFVVCIVAMLLAQLFVRPIRRLEAGAQRITGGDYDVAIPVETRDEIGDLTVAFNEMSRNLAIKEELLAEQRKENDRLLLSLMPEQVAQRYREGEQTIVQDHQDVTVMFADIVGLDAMSEELPSDESLRILNELLREFDVAAEGLGVERVRTLRSGYLASCGLTVPRLDNVRRTVDFALEMQRVIDRFNKSTGRRLALRAGIDTGTVTTGLVGRSTIVYDMWGAAVNLAYQVQSGTPQPGIYVTADVYEMMRDSRHFTAAGTIAVDGAEKAVWRLSERQS